MLNTNTKTHPDWSQWQSFPKLRLWRLIRLSLNIDPAVKGAAVEYKNMSKDHSTEYERRLRQARNSLSETVKNGTILFHPNDPNNGEQPQHRMVDISSFIEWALRMKWVIPPEMHQMGVLQPPEESLSTAMVKPCPKNVLNASITRAHRTTQLLLLAALSDGINYQGPEQEKEAIKAIVRGLKKLGISCQTSTIKKHIQEAHGHFLGI